MQRRGGYRVTWMLQVLVALSSVSLATSSRAREGVDSSEGRVVFVLAADASAALESSLRDAIEAQFAGMGASVTFQRFDQRLPDLRGQVEAVRELADRFDARGVFWLDAAPEGDWLLYLAERSGDRVLVRRLPTPESAAAAIEAVSVITRESTSALVAGSTIGMQPVSDPAAADEDAKPPAAVHGTELPGERSPPTTGSEKTPEERRSIRVHVGYRGNSFAPSTGWQSGGEFGAAWYAEQGFFLGASAAIFPPVRISDALTTFEVSRLPFSATTGWHFRPHWVSVDVMAVYTAEIFHRGVVDAAAGAEGTASTTRLVSLVGLRSRLERALLPTLGLYVQAGTDLIVNRFQYVAEEADQSRSLLDPYRVRVVVDVGLAVWL